MKRTPLNRTSPRPRRNGNPYILKLKEDVQTIDLTKLLTPRKPQRDPWRLSCGALWPVDYWPEKKFQAEVENLASLLGWEHSHAHLPYFDTAGIPDLFMVHPRKKRMMFRELKVRDPKGRLNKPSPAQVRWMNWIRDAGGDVAVWDYPDDWRSGRIEKELSA